MSFIDFAEWGVGRTPAGSSRSCVCVVVEANAVYVYISRGVYIAAAASVWCLTFREEIDAARG